jgi:hypothetical protein
VRKLLLSLLLALCIPATAEAQVPTLPPLSPELQRIVNCEDPAFPPQSPSGQCATLIEVVREGDNGNADAWTCTQPLDNYGPRPIIVNHVMFNSPDNPNGAIRLGDTPGAYGTDTCTVLSQRVGTGPSVTCQFDGKADLFLQVNGNRGNIGSNNDLVKSFGAHCIEIGDATHSGGKWTGGAVSSGAHQDGLNSNYIRGVHLHGIVIGDWTTQESGAHGAGGIWYMDWLDQDSGADNSHHHWNVVCFRCILIGSGNTAQGEEHPGQPDGTGGAGLSFGESDDSGAVDSCIAHRRPLVFFATSSNGSNQINVGNTFVDRDTDTQADWDACPLIGDPPPPPVDTDGDGVPDAEDNCPTEPGPAENGGCPIPPPPTDNDGDGVPNDADNCVDVANPGQEDSDADGAGNACDTATWAQYDALAALVAQRTAERDAALAELAECQQKIDNMLIQLNRTGSVSQIRSRVTNAANNTTLCWPR